MKRNPDRNLSVYVASFYIGLLALWQLLFSLGLIRDYLFPSPSHVAQRLWELGRDGMLGRASRRRCGAWCIGFAISADSV
jgi:ABC-type nitrate/sulfonate/bicarbonate transport system permease component